jgi:hypothetical protein
MWIKGFTYGWKAVRGAYRTEKAIASQDKLFDLGINWMCLAFFVEQKGFASTEIYYDYRKTITDKDISFAIKRAHDRGIKVCLKPVINCSDGMWRALIDFPDEDMLGKDRYWNAWFEYYTAFICHYAELAQDTGCEMLCIGCEMSGTERKEKHWRDLIQKVRAIYSGPLVYNANHGREEQVPWFDALDYIGTSAYYRVAKADRDTMEDMLQAWNKVGTGLERLADKYGKQIIFMEIGCRSAKGCAAMPWDFAHRDLTWDEEEQAAFYASCLTALQDKEWFAGAFWWDWSTEVYDSREEAMKDRGFDIHLKKAETVIKKWYRGDCQGD